MIYFLLIAIGSGYLMAGVVDTLQGKYAAGGLWFCYACATWLSLIATR